jgi:hypothetical protein
LIGVALAVASHFDDPPSFDHFVGQRQQLVGDFEAELLRGLEVEHGLVG